MDVRLFISKGIGIFYRDLSEEQKDLLTRTLWPEELEDITQEELDEIDVPDLYVTVGIDNDNNIWFIFIELSEREYLVPPRLPYGVVAGNNNVWKSEHSRRYLWPGELSEFLLYTGDDPEYDIEKQKYRYLIDNLLSIPNTSGLKPLFEDKTNVIPGEWLVSSSDY